MRPVDVFHIGPQKAAHTWMYACMREHPDVFCPARDCLYYFDMLYSRGREWYEQFFAGARDEQKLLDPTCTYIRSPWAPRRIAQENAEAKIVLCMRDPVERAFSHYWQQKKRRVANWDFSAVLSDYDLFSSWMEPGFYAEHIERYLEYFPREQILCQIFDDLKRDPTAFLAQLLKFIGVDSGFRPSVRDDVVNEASVYTSPVSRALNKARELVERSGFGSAVRRSPRVYSILSGKSEYINGPSRDVELRLREIAEPEIQRVERLLGIELSRWRRTFFDEEAAVRERIQRV